jgi:type IV secretion system protein VirB10
MNEQREGAPDEARDAPETGQVVGDRGALSRFRVGSLQTRVTNMLALGLICIWVLGMLGWYYVHNFQTQSRAKQAARSAPLAQAQGDMPLPSLGRITSPASTPPESPERTNPLLGPPPEPPPPDLGQVSSNEPGRPSNSLGTQVPASPKRAVKWHGGANARRLSGPAFSTRSESQMSSSSTDGTSSPANNLTETGTPGAAIPQSDAGLPSLLRPSVTETVRASVLPTKRLLLPKGAFIDCTLETAIDSTLPGMATCVTATDTFSVDGTTVLLERGTKLVGETRGEVQQGSARVFVLWTEARTPTGVVVPLASPGTDELGRSGLAGEVDRYFFQRFGAAMLISVIDGAVQGAVQGAAQSSHGGGTIIYNPSGSEQVMTEVLKGTVNISPTVRKRNGDRIEILVARDVDFRNVYELRAAR